MSVKMKSIFQTVLLLCMLFVVGNLSAQNTIKGTVTDATGEAVIGATVMEKGNSKNATVTDFDGNFTLKVSGKNPIEVSYIGMKTKSVDVKGKSVVNVKLEEEDNSLNEVVVIGYGTVRKKDLTGAVSQVSSKQIENIPVSNVSEALTGKLAGVNITTTEGSPDADVKIRVRGGGSLSQDNSPLYIVDGFPVASISDIAPSEIETIDVLKDASSTAIYGAQGANGVVIVTTKSGKEGNVQVTLNASLGWKSITKERFFIINKDKAFPWDFQAGTHLCDQGQIPPHLVRMEALYLPPEPVPAGIDRVHVVNPHQRRNQGCVKADDQIAEQPDIFLTQIRKVLLQTRDSAAQAFVEELDQDLESLRIAVDLLQVIVDSLAKDSPRLSHGPGELPHLIERSHATVPVPEHIQIPGPDRFRFGA